MRTLLWAIGFMVLPLFTTAQTISKKLENAVSALLSDPQMKHGLLGLYVVNSATGQLVYQKNGTVGMAAASSQKVITAATAYELLGTSYRFKTTVGYTGTINNGALQGDLVLRGYGDPTLGSTRYSSTAPAAILQEWSKRLQASGINSIGGTIKTDESVFALQPLPGGWIWDDIGNYYGAGHYAVNWRENQYDLVLKAGDREGDSTSIVRTVPPLVDASLVNQVLTGKQGSGDNAFIYLPPYSNSGFSTGTIPAGAKAFSISGAFPWPARQLTKELNNSLLPGNTTAQQGAIQGALLQHRAAIPATVLFTHYSPSLDSIVYWFLRKSVNLYGEAIIRTIGWEQTGYGSTEAGLTATFNLWKKAGVDSLAINMKDGSGLSPQNRITPQAFVQVLQYARTQSWFNGFYNALPMYNGIKMKSGTIGGAKSFTGYVKSDAGVSYTFSIIVNNYNGPSSAIVKKMYKVLNVLK